MALQILWLLRLSLLSLEDSYLNLITLVRFLNCCKCNSRNMHLTALVMGLVTHSSNRPCAYFARGLSVLVEVLASTQHEYTSIQHFTISVLVKGARMRYQLPEFVTSILSSEMRSAAIAF